MNPRNLKSMSVDELWSLHELVVSVLARKISSEQAALEQKLRELGHNKADSIKQVSHARRPYPQVFPKYRNPARPAETWAGRGKQPRWLTAELRSGKSSMISGSGRRRFGAEPPPRKVVAAETKTPPRGGRLDGEPGARCRSQERVFRPLVLEPDFFISEWASRILGGAMHRSGLAMQW